ncbi:MAG: hypothetical protein IT423_11070, partial [Pirellulaceae bacterium]|nr:hypothetical protein [Pirellulaceae bacterium]
MPRDFNMASHLNRLDQSRLPTHDNLPNNSSQSRWLMLLIIICLSLPIDYPPIDSLFQDYMPGNNLVDSHQSNRNRPGSSWLIGNLCAQDAGLKLPVTRDTWLSSVPQERGGANGGASRLKLKSYQEMSLVDFDTSSLVGRVIGKATLHVRSSSDAKFKRVTVSSVSADWTEGDNTNYSASPGVSTFANRAHPDVPWSYPGSDFCSVILSQGYSRWASRDATAPDQDGWQQIPMDPAVVAMRVAQLSYGFLVFDDTGTEWSRSGEQFTAQPFPNRYAFSREQGVRHAPYLVVELTDEDRMPPEAPTALRVSKADLPTGQWKLNWVSPADRGPAGTLGFVMHIDDQPIQRYLVPKAGQPGQPVEMLLRDMSLDTTRKHTLSIAAVDVAG